jgi:AraC-like DNA-binding protein
MIVAFSTQELKQRDRIPYWVDVATQAYFKHGFSASSETFAGSLDAERFGSILLSRCACGPCAVTRERLEIARDDIDDVILGVRQSGRSILSQYGRQHVVDPGTLILQDCGRPLRVDFLEHTKSIFVSIPRSVFNARVGNTAQASMVLAKTPIAGLAADFVTMLAARCATLEDPVKTRLGEQALDLIALAVTAAEGRPTLSAPRATALLRLKVGIEARLSDPNLRPAEAAAAAGISVRYANALLGQEGLSIERYIVHRRLQRCRDAIEDPSQAHRKIGDIAFGWGFSDLSHFTRRFRDTFGMTPGDCRRARETNTAAGE